MNKTNKNFRLNKYSRELSIFQTVCTRPVTMIDVQDCIDSTQGLNTAIKRGYYESSCVNYDNVQKYYTVVNDLNTMYYRDHAIAKIVAFVYHCVGFLFDKLSIGDFVL
jgi:hypothetical protein